MQVLVTSQSLTDIANAIRAKTGSSARLTPGEMSGAIAALPVTDDIDKLLSGDTTLTSFSSATLTRLKPGAFTRCFQLASVNCPLVETAGSYAFESCLALTSVSLPALRDVYATYHANGNSQFNQNGGLFYNCRGLTEISLPSFEAVPVHCFANCANLQKAYLPASKSLHNSVFINNTNLVKVWLACGSLGQMDFYQCPALTTIVIDYEGVCTLPSTDNFGYTTPSQITVYVPSDYVSEYEAATNWAAMVSQGLTFAALEDHPEILANW